MTWTLYVATGCIAFGEMLTVVWLLIQNHDGVLDLAELVELMDQRHYLHGLNEVSNSAEECVKS